MKTTLQIYTVKQICEGFTYSETDNSHYVCSEKAVNWIYNSVEGRS